MGLVQLDAPLAGFLQRLTLPLEGECETYVGTRWCGSLKNVGEGALARYVAESYTVATGHNLHDPRLLERNDMNISKPPLEVVTATMDDLSLLVPLFDAYRQFYKQASDQKGARRFLAAHLAHGTSVIFLAVRPTAEGERSACGFAQLYPSFSSVALKPLWIFNDLFVAPDARRMGVGRALLSHAHAFAISTGARGLTLKTAVDNASAQALYEESGWQRDEQFYSYHLYV